MGNISPPTFFFCKIALPVLGLLNFYMNFVISLSISTKNTLDFCCDFITSIDYLVGILQLNNIDSSANKYTYLSSHLDLLMFGKESFVVFTSILHLLQI